MMSRTTQNGKVVHHDHKENWPLRESGSDAEVGEKWQEARSDTGTQFEDLLDAVGGFGRYQQIIIYLAILPAFFSYAYANGFWLFVIATPEKYWCQVPQNYSSGQLIAEGSQQCEVRFPASSNSVSPTGNQSVPCETGWTYEQTSYLNTIVTEWDLVCSRDFLATLMYIITSIVGTLAGPLGGWCSDHYGRKRTYFLFLILEIISGVAVAFSPSYWAFVVLSSIHTIAVYPTYQALYTLGLEILRPDKRTFFVVLLGFAYALGGMACCAVAYFVRDWRSLVLACTVPLIGLFFLWWIMPESPRFNLSQKKYGKVEHYFRRAAKWNHRSYETECREKSKILYESISMQDGKTETNSHSFRELFIVPKLRKRLFVLMSLSTVVGISYGGLGYYAPKFGNNPYLNVFLTSVVDLPAALLTQLAADRLGRRLTLIMDFSLGSLVCLATLCFPQTDEYYYPTLILFLLARMFAVSSYTMEELVSCENFPTVLRGEGISLTNGVSGIVSSLGPLIVYLSVGNDLTTPMAWFGGVTIVGCFLVILIPETAHKPLPETLDDFQDYTVLRSWRELLCVQKRP